MDNTDDGLIEVVLATDYPPLGLAGDAVRVDPMRAEWLRRSGTELPDKPFAEFAEESAEPSEPSTPVRGRRRMP